MKRRQILKSLSAATASVACAPLFANDDQPLKLVVPYAAGGLTDMMSRLLTKSMGESLKRPVPVENRPGAAGLIATNLVMNQGKDGSMLMLINNGFVSLPLLTQGARYDPIKDFKAVAGICAGASMLMINASVPAATLPEFIAWAKTVPGGINAANSGIGSSGHLATMMFAKRTGITVTHIPYKGSAETANALLSGQVHMQLTATTAYLNEQVKAGKVRILATSGAERSALQPDLPTISSVVPDFATEGWYGMVTNAAVDDARVEQYGASIQKALEEPGVAEKYAAIFMEVQYRAPQAFRRQMEKSTDYWKGIIAELNLVRT